MRLRECPQGDCPGFPAESGQCNQRECPSWGEWAEWGDCSRSCGFGLKMRDRECLNAEHHPDGCDEGMPSDATPCNTDACTTTTTTTTTTTIAPIWSEWGEWESCSQECGPMPGVRMRLRECLQGNCEGFPAESGQCNQRECPAWGEWAEWGECSRSCGFGLKMRERECVNSEHHSDGCDDGMPSDAIPCNTDACPTTTTVTTTSTTTTTEAATTVGWFEATWAQTTSALVAFCPMCSTDDDEADDRTEVAEAQSEESDQTTEWWFKVTTNEDKSTKSTTTTTTSTTTSTTTTTTTTQGLMAQFQQLAGLAGGLAGGLGGLDLFGSSTDKISYEKTESGQCITKGFKQTNDIFDSVSHLAAEPIKARSMYEKLSYTINKQGVKDFMENGSEFCLPGAGAVPCNLLELDDDALFILHPCDLVDKVGSVLDNMALKCKSKWKHNKKDTFKDLQRTTGCTIGLQDFPNLDGNFDYGPENMPLESTFGLGRRRGSKNKKRKGSTFFRALAPESKKSSKGKKKNRIALKSAASGRSLCSVQDHVNDYAVQIANSNFANIAFKESHQTGLRLEQPFTKIIKFIADVSSKCSNAEANCALIDAIFKQNTDDNTELLLENIRKLSILIEDMCPTMIIGIFNQLFGARRH